MAAQGWQPGDFLGAKDARQAEHYTAASASHIRVIIKDDNLGLGAKIGSGVGHGECTGLDAFKDLLGRLNGRDENELEQEKKSREDLKRAIYSERKWGSTRFVHGGFLIGDKIQPLIEAEAERVRKLAAETLDSAGTSPSDSSSSSESEEEILVVEKPKKSKKRKLEDQEPVPEVVAVKVKKSKRDRKSEARLEGTVETEDSVPVAKESKKKSKKNRQSEDDDDAIEEERRRRKKEKKEKKARKEEERLRSHDKQDPAKVPEKSKRKSGRASIPESIDSPSQTTTRESASSTSVPSSGYSTPMMQGRHAVRSRNIAQKRLASMDIASLNQVSPPYPYTCISVD